MLIRASESIEKRPLLVSLHSWSSSYTQTRGETPYARWCIENDWHFIHPHFRGPNRTPDACGSDKVVQDILDAVSYMQIQHKVDADRIYLVGVSGGGHAALLMAGRAPKIWAGVSAWASISDIGAWWKQKSTGAKSRYAQNIEQAVGGPPDTNEAAAQECTKRSPLTYLAEAASVNLDINAGVTDGHAGGSVPFTHSLHAFNQVAIQVDRVPVALINSFYDKQALPPSLPTSEADPLYGDKQPVFRTTSQNTRVTIFQGKHEILHHAALNWLAQQRRGKPATWNITPTHALKTVTGESQSGK